MSVTERDHEIQNPVVPPQKRSRLPKALVGVGAVFVLIVGAVMLVIALVFGMIITGRAQSDDVAIEQPVISETINNDVAYGYFGDVALARNSTLTTTVDGVDSIDEIRILTTPSGIDSKLISTEDGVLLEIKVGSDIPSGQWVMTFDIDGQSAPVEWVFTVL